jgi:hypothetical protein
VLNNVGEQLDPAAGFMPYKTGYTIYMPLFQAIKDVICDLAKIFLSVHVKLLI